MMKASLICSEIKSNALKEILKESEFLWHQLKEKTISLDGAEIQLQVLKNMLFTVALDWKYNRKNKQLPLHK